MHILFAKFSGAMFIQGAIFIPDSRVWLEFHQFSPKLLKIFEKLRMIDIGNRGAERGHPYCRCCILVKKVDLQSFDLSKKELICQIFHQKKFRKF